MAWPAATAGTYRRSEATWCTDVESDYFEPDLFGNLSVSATVAVNTVNTANRFLLAYNTRCAC